MKNCFNCNKEVEPDFKVCPYCGVRLDEIECPVCHYKNEPNSKFCQECGNKLLEGTGQKSKELSKVTVINEVETIEDVPKEGVTIEFNYSSSQSFEFAVKSASEFKSFRKFGEGKKALYRVTVKENEMDRLDELIENLKGWRNRRVYLNGEKVQWDNIFCYAWCYNQKKNSFKPELYCFGYERDYNINIWGCIQSNLFFTEYSELFTFGKWINNRGDWQFDKERIRHYLEKNLYLYRFCPAINLALTDEAINAFPDIVNPNKDKNWEFVEDYGSTEGLLVKRQEYGFTETVYMKCVAPKRRKPIIEEISKRMKLKLPEKIVGG